VQETDAGQLITDGERGLRVEGGDALGGRVSHHRGALAVAVAAAHAQRRPPARGARERRVLPARPRRARRRRALDRLLGRGLATARRGAHAVDLAGGDDAHLLAGRGRAQRDPVELGSGGQVAAARLGGGAARVALRHRGAGQRRGRQRRARRHRDPAGQDRHHCIDLR